MATIPYVWNDTASAALTASSGNGHEVDPISRIEGHLGVKVVTDASGKIVDANAHANLWRGFENFLLGRAANDAITFTQRICGVCPVPHGMTSTYAVDNVLGYSKGHITFETDSDGYGVPAKAVLIRNMVLSAEFLMSHITHFYHLVAPSYVQGPAIPPWTPYFGSDNYHPALLSTAHGTGATPSATSAAGIVPDAASGTMKLWDAVIISYVRALKMRRLTFEAGALFAGRMPMTSCFVGGGVTTVGTEDLTAKCEKFIEIIRTVGEFIVQEYVPIALVLGALYPEFDNVYNVGRSLVSGHTSGDVGYGAGLGRFLAWGAFPSTGTTSAAGLTLPGGFYDANVPSGFTVANKGEVWSTFVNPATTGTCVPSNLTEDITNARYKEYADDVSAYTSGAAYPGAVTRTQPARADGYTYIKAPRWNGQACEVGPFARLVVAGYYPVLGTALAAGGASGQYLKFANNSTKLNINLLAPTVANGLVNTLTLSEVTGAVSDWVIHLQGGLSTMDRLRARAIESFVLVQAMVGTVTTDDAGTITWADDGWAQQLKAKTGDAGTSGTPVLDVAGSTWTNKSIPLATVHGWGATEAPRGALMHQITITNGKIDAYQCIVPTTWNGSPKDAAGKNGAIEKAMIGATFHTGGSYGVSLTGPSSATITAVGGVEVLRIAQSFDPCIACAVH